MMCHLKGCVRGICSSKNPSSADDAQEEHGVHDIVEGVDANNVFLARSNTPFSQACHELSNDNARLSG